MTYYGLYKDANRLLDKSKISLGEYERMIEPLNDEVRKVGKWKVKSFHECFCDNCGFSFDIMKCDFLENMKHCPNCGAKMERSER